ncbi:hypothetical protein DB30_01857 [Enhygromyxa salina]|uniref:Hemerythrin-like domain-containing protein n=1 Tax=Enhygromyxa salina TaxID=215803 RepID=A0A0C1Z3K2_9BACT|nr:hemerythrin domain-containing protein [Enhygromyxa salina]KIG12174.1 hypothetical protein DB30_01857 [Enhygromyxa salina]
MSAPSPSIPREHWTTHPHFPDQVLLLGSHANFRRISSYLVRAAEASEGPAGIASLYMGWIAAMRSHEAYEERKLYPYLARRWAMNFDAACAGHELLHRLHVDVVTALSQAGDSQAATPMLAAALRRHDTALVEHLELEEDLVIPCLLALEPEEFHTYTMLSLPALLARLDNDADRAVQ